MRLMKVRTTAFERVLSIFLALAALNITAPARAADAGNTQATARQSPDWLRDAVVYEVFPRAFSPDGNFKGVIGQLEGPAHLR